jgi:cytochrome b561
MIATRILAWTVVLAMAGAIIYGFANGNFGSNGSAIWALPWGKVSLIDLYAGLLLFAGWIWIRETAKPRIVLWWVALVVLGNLAAGIYVVAASLKAETTTELLTGSGSSAG